MHSGLIGRKFCVITFDGSGELVDVCERSFEARLASEGKGIQLDELQSMVDAEVRQVRAERGLVDEAVAVKRFRLIELNVGIDDLPDDLQEHASKRNSTSLKEEDLEESIAGWHEDSLYVFWWGQSFYVDSEGIVTSS